MLYSFTIRRIVILIIVVFAACGTVRSEVEQAWQAIHNLEIAQAKEFFQRELKNSPEDLSLMRGLLLAAYFDLDYQTQIDMVEAMVQADPRNPYLIPIHEHVAANLTGWSDQADLYNKIGKALTKHSSGPFAHTGKHIIETYHKMATCSPPDDWLEKMGYAPGGWVSGPFENQSKISAYRQVPFEGQKLDTLSMVTGKNGSKAGWTWLPSDQFGDFHPSFAMENTEKTACQFRAFFELPSDMTILLLLGGLYHGRFIMDGKEIYSDPVFRNAIQREGFRVQLDRGSHEITLVLGGDTLGVNFSVAILDTNYQPIKDLKWPRYAHFSLSETFEVEKFHPIFDPFDAYVEKTGQEPDTRYWKAILKTYNGYAAEIARELEKFSERNGLSLLETWGLYESLEYNAQQYWALKFLNEIKEQISNPKIDLNWISATSENYETTIKAAEQLNYKYPERFDIEFMKAHKSILSQDIKTLLADLEGLKKKYPGAASISSYMSWIYLILVNDPESSFREFTESCKLSKNKRLQIVENSNCFIRMRKYDKAVDHAKKAVEKFPQSDGAISQLFYAYDLAQRTKELIPMLESLKSEFPYNIELHAMLHEIYSNAGQFDRAQQILQQIHILKPSAVLPYMALDSLHNNANYDSIFGSLDVMTYWDTQPSEEELGGKKLWRLIDRNQVIVFESGMTLRDEHWAVVLMDRETVEQFQEIYLGFNPDEKFKTLLVARRLRKDQPPLSGTVEGEFAIFKDLQPGDAVEIHRRYWRSGEGDLWKEFWDTQTVFADLYQRYWEYTILTNRSDLRYETTSPASQPVIDTHCGFKKISWREEKIPAWELELGMLPPLHDLVGKVFLSTTSEWEVLNSWYASVSEAVLGENPRTKDLVQMLTEGKISHLEKLQSLYSYVVLEIPYQLMGFDYHSSIPQKPDEVLLNRWGDCKDKSHLLIQMLRQVDIDAWPVLVMTRDYGTQLPLPQFEFDHLITCCVINGDTMFVDPTELLYPPQNSLSLNVSGQPYMLVGAKQDEELRRLPSPETQTPNWNFRMKIMPRENGECDFIYEQKVYNLETGYRKFELESYSKTELRQNMESTYSQNWGVTLSLDSISHDSIRTIDSVFNETYYGSIDLNIQTIGKTTIVTPPHWSTIPASLLPLLQGAQKRQFPIDLRNYVGRFEKRLEFSVPPEYGNPQLPDTKELKDSLFKYDFSCDWNENTRILLLHHILEVQDGYTDPDSFISFSRKVIDTFESPLLFQKD